MASKVRQWRNHESARRESRPSSSDSGRHKGATTMESGKTKTSEGAVAARTEESSSSSGIDHRKKAGLIEIDGRGNISSVAFLVDGEHVVSGGWEEKVRRWRIEDGEEVGTPMDAGSAVCNIAVSRDGKWVVGGTFDGWVTVWNAESQKRVARIIGHNSWVRAVDVSPDGTRIATGSKDKTACVWSLSTGERLVGPLEHDNWVAAVKISPDGCLLAAATRKRHSLRIYHSQDGRLLVDFPVEVNSTFNQSLAWASDSDQLFALSLDGDIHCLDVYTGTTLVKWPIHSSENARCIALAKNSTLIAASAGSSVSFWNTTTREQIGSVIEFTHDIWSMAISVNYDLVVGGERTITFRGLCDILPPSYFDDIPRKQRIGHRKIESANLEETPSVESRNEQQNADEEKEKESLIQSLRAQEENSSNNITRLEKTVQELRNELAKSQRAANEEKDSHSVITRSLREDHETQETSSSNNIARLETTVQELHNELARSERAANEQKDSLNVIIRSLRESLESQETSSSDNIARLEKTIQELSNELAMSERAASEQKDSLNATIRSLRESLESQETSSSNNIACLEKTVQELRNELTMSKRAATEQKDTLHVIIGSLRADLETDETSSNELSDYQHTASHEDGMNETIDFLRAILRARDDHLGNKFSHLEQIDKELRIQLAESHYKADTLIRIVRAHEQGHHCESLYHQGRIYEAVESLLEIANAADEDVRANDMIINWLAEFTQRCVIMLERVGDEASKAKKQDEAVRAYSAALSLSPSTPNNVLMKWATVMLIRGSSHDALNAAAKFKVPRFLAYRIVCDILERNGHLTKAIKCYRQMQSEPPEEMGTHDEQVQWGLDFRKRCVERLEKLGDTAREAKKHDEAIRYYSHALSLGPTNINDIRLKRCTEVIELEPSSHEGYEGKHAALHSMGRYREAFETFKTMLLKLEQSPDPRIRELCHQYFDATATIQQVVGQTIRDLPRVLIDTITGHLYDRVEQAAAFEQLSIYDELRSSMTTRTQLDNARIQREVGLFYRYVMLSHKWQPNEPTFQMVENTSIYKLPVTPSNSKVQRFCELVRSLDFQWAWSDTCCVNQLDRGVQQESLVAMFRWYRGSSLTIVHLLGVLSESQKIGCLWKSIWNTRGWTYQEYVASGVVQFYTEDWKPYLNLDIFNHKESPIILSEMERAMNFATQELATLQPGLQMAREKLYLASTRQTTREEDIAYSLFGIFNVAIPVIYGEGNQAVGRLLEYILMRSANVTLLAWTGNSGSHYSYLPADLTVYNRIVPPHVPLHIEMAELDGMVMALRSSLPDLTLPIALYERLYHLPPLSLVAGRLRLPGIVFRLTDLVPILESDSESNLPAYRATSHMLGTVKIRTKDQLYGLQELFLIHPWISPLLDEDFSRGVAQLDLATRALRLVVRLKQPFGALLLAPLAREQFGRIATDGLIMAQVRKETLLNELMDGIRMVDIQ